jgi:hypothetical protein
MHPDLLRLVLSRYEPARARLHERIDREVDARIGSTLALAGSPQQLAESLAKLAEVPPEIRMAAGIALDHALAQCAELLGALVLREVCQELRQGGVLRLPGAPELPPVGEA